MKKILPIALSMFFAGQVMAAPITYDEAVDGDLEAGISTLNLGNGVNTVSGSVVWSHDGIVDDDFDGFDFNLGSGSAVTSIFIDLALQNTGSGTWSNIGWSLKTGSGNLNESLSFPQVNQSIFNSALPLSSGSFSLNQNSASGGLAQGDYRIADYTLTFNVSSIPAPLSLALFCLGLAGIGFSRRMK